MQFTKNTQFSNISNSCPEVSVLWNFSEINKSERT